MNVFLVSSGDVFLKFLNSSKIIRVRDQWNTKNIIDNRQYRAMKWLLNKAVLLISLFRLINWNICFLFLEPSQKVSRVGICSFDHITDPKQTAHCCCRRLKWRMHIATSWNFQVNKNLYSDGLHNSINLVRDLS